jgi:invasion protein IalB
MNIALSSRARRLIAPLLISLLPVLAVASESTVPTGGEIASQAFDDWALLCAEETDAAGKAVRHCEISQAVAVEDQGRAVEILRLAVSRSGKGAKAAFTLVALAPLDVHLPSQFGLFAGDTKLALASYRNCNPNGCFVLISLSKQDIKRLKKARQGAALFRDLGGRPIKLSFSLKGFTRAFDSLAADVTPAALAGAEKKQ